MTIAKKHSKHDYKKTERKVYPRKVILCEFGRGIKYMRERTEMRKIKENRKT